MGFMFGKISVKINNMEEEEEEEIYGMKMIIVMGLSTDGRVSRAIQNVGIN